MLQWLQSNAVSIAVVAVLALIVIVVVFKMISDQKKGKSCCGNCQSCGKGCACPRPTDSE